MKQIDNIRAELLRGYQLNITKGSNDICYGSLIFMPHTFLISSCEEVEVRTIMQNFPSILKTLEELSTTCTITYDLDKKNIVTKIRKEKTSEPYCEENHYEVLENLQVETKDIFTGLINLEEKCEKYIERKTEDKVKVKVK